MSFLTHEGRVVDVIRSNNCSHIIELKSGHVIESNATPLPQLSVNQVSKPA